MYVSITLTILKEEVCFKLKEKKRYKIYFSSTLEERLGINIPNSEETFYRHL